MWWWGARWRRHWRVIADNGRVSEYGVQLRLGVGKGGSVRLVVAVNTLLGPEKTTCVWGDLRVVAVFSVIAACSYTGSGLSGLGCLVWVCGGGCVFVENYTVDASIFIF
jgi:hypothetical protein